MPQHNWFEMGQWNACCDVCGRVFKSGKIRLRWDKARVCDSCFEVRHPQDFVRPVKDDPSVPWARGWNPNFTSPSGQIDDTIGGFVIGEGRVGGL